MSHPRSKDSNKIFLLGLLDGLNESLACVSGKKQMPNHCFVIWGRLGQQPGSASGKEPAANTGDTRDVGLIPGSGRSPRGGHGNALQYSCLGNPVHRGA